MRIHGGIGYAEESDVSRCFVNARVLPSFEGAEETLALKVVGKALIGQPDRRRRDRCLDRASSAAPCAESRAD